MFNVNASKCKYSKTPFIATPVYCNLSSVYRNKPYHFFPLLLVEGVVT